MKTEFGNTIKCSVTSNRGPNEINIKIKEIHRKHLLTIEEMKQEVMCSYLFDEERMDDYLEAYENNKYCKYHIRKETYEKIEEIINKYNYDNCDSYTDYFDVNYFDRWDTRYGGVVVLDD